MNSWRKLLLPFNPIYYLATYSRNLAYDKGWFKSQSYNFPVICVGNLSVGGTGKTPMIEYLIRLLSQDFKIATLSRGYKRSTSGFRMANDSDSVKTIGDEPYQFFLKFGSDILVSVDENRQRGIQRIIMEHPEVEVVLLDDAFQHRRVKAGFNILLTPYYNLYSEDMMLPAGDLREPKSGAKRADIIVVTKCPNDLSDTEKQGVIDRLKPESNQEIFFSSIKYSNMLQSSYQEPITLEELSHFTLVTGIANPKPLLDYLEGNKNLSFDHLNFPDHHNFSENDLDRISENSLIVTTEKDYMRLKEVTSLKNKLYFLPIQIDIDRPKEFNEIIWSYFENEIR